MSRPLVRGRERRAADDEWPEAREDRLQRAVHRDRFHQAPQPEVVHGEFHVPARMRRVRRERVQ